MSSQQASERPCKVFVRDGFDWRAADVYLFDIDGTLLNSKDAVHYFAFHTAIEHVWRSTERIDRVPVHGNTDIGILRCVAENAGISPQEFSDSIAELCRVMGEEVAVNRAGLKPELCESVGELVRGLHASGKLLGVATGNLEPIGWAKIEACGLRRYFSFGAFSALDRERRADIFRDGMAQAHQLAGGYASVYVVGDTPSDIAAAREVGIPVIAVATGKYPFETLRDLQPDMAVGCCADLLAFTAESE